VTAIHSPDLLAEAHAERDHYRKMWQSEVANAQRLALDYQQARDCAEKAEAEVERMRPLAELVSVDCLRDYQQARDRAERAEADMQALSLLQSRTCEMVREVEAQRDALRAAARTLLANPGVTKCPGGTELKAALEEYA
jgi:hypothetical protein